MFERLTGERDASWVLSAFKRRWWVILLVTAVGAAAAYEFSMRQTKEYTATSSLLFLNTPLDQELLGKQIISNVDPTRQAATNQALVELPTVSRMVAKMLHAPVAEIQSRISFGSDSTSDVMSVSATSVSPQRAAGIANLYAQDFIRFRKRAAIAQITTAESLIDGKLAAIPRVQQGGAVAQALIADRNELDLLKSTQTGDTEIVETASVPQSPSSPKPVEDAVLGGLLACLVAACLVAVSERRDQRVKSPDEVETIYGAPVVGTVPQSGALRADGRGTARDREAFLMVRAQLRYFDVDRPIKRVMVSSPETGEGKSLIALNLARAAARTDDSRTLLIEADLRVPSLHGIVQRERTAGLAELLSHSQDLESALGELVVTAGQTDETDHPERLDLLLAGSIPPPNPAELLESKRMQELLSLTASLYDNVIIDTPPIGVVSDAIPLIHQVDGVVVVSRMGVSHRDQAVRLMRRLRSLNAHILGVVVNSHQAHSDSQYGYYEYLHAGNAVRRAGSSRGRVRR
jgi:succinoglycan biosynthesis transport protein ExoP